jgi:hypothetical protein
MVSSVNYVQLYRANLNVPSFAVGELKGRKMTIKEQVNAIGEAFMHGHRRILGDKLYGVYIYGAAAFPDDLPTGDIDFHVILTDPLTDDERSHLYELHDCLGRDFPPLGVDMDGYYILLTDARGTDPPQSEMWQRATDKSWALHREHILAGRVIVLHGPDPKDIYPPTTWKEIEQALEGEFKYVEDHLDEYPHYCILQLCRLIYSYETRDVVVSKAQASDWARTALPKWRQHVELARKSYAGQATEEDRKFMLAEIRSLLEFARERIEQARERRRK